MKTAKLIMTGALAVALGLTSSGITNAVDKPADLPKAVKPGDALKSEEGKASLFVKVIDKKTGNLLFTFIPYKNVEINTKVSLQKIQDEVKIDGYTVEYLGAPILLDKDYTMELYATQNEEEPAKDEPKKDEPKKEDPAKGNEDPSKGKDEPKGDKEKPKTGKAAPKAGGSKTTGKKLPKTSAVK